MHVSYYIAIFAAGSVAYANVISIPEVFKRDASQCGPGNTGSGGQVCGMGNCCSSAGYCGTTSAHCGSGCQSAYGNCGQIFVPNCNGLSGAAYKRTVGYWQAASVQGGSGCSSTPPTINTNGLTHLNYAFVKFDANTFTVQEDSPSLYKQFTALNSTVQTWVSIGGGGFSTSAWTSMASSSESRRTFINSLKSFMIKYGFQGADIDWEFPGPSDTANLVALIKEMRAAFGYQLGISFALAPDYGDMRYTDAYGMRPFLDWFNLMAYDMNYGSTVLKAHTDIRDITALTRNLFANNIDMSKVNLGLAYYGRGFTLGNKNCNTLDNSCAGTAKVSAYGCSSGTDGVLTLADIKSLIQSRGLTPTYNSDAMVQTITWDNNWIAYDDEKTLPLKRNWATQNCFGGTAIWSVDLYNKGRAY